MVEYQDILKSEAISELSFATERSAMEAFSRSMGPMSLACATAWLLYAVIHFI